MPAALLQVQKKNESLSLAQEFYLFAHNELIGLNEKLASELTGSFLNWLQTLKNPDPGRAEEQILDKNQQEFERFYNNLKLEYLIYFTKAREIYRLTQNVVVEHPELQGKYTFRFLQWLEQRIRWVESGINQDSEIEIEGGPISVQEHKEFMGYYAQLKKEYLDKSHKCQIL